MILWTEFALRAEIEYRQEKVRQSFRPRKRWQDADALSVPSWPTAVRIPTQRTAGPGERPAPLSRRTDADARRGPW